MHSVWRNMSISLSLIKTHNIPIRAIPKIFSIGERCNYSLQLYTSLINIFTPIFVNTQCSIQCTALNNAQRCIITLNFTIRHANCFDKNTGISTNNRDFYEVEE